MHRTAGKSYEARYRKKLTEKSEWFRDRTKETHENDKEELPDGWKKQSGMTAGQEREKTDVPTTHRTRSVLFVEVTRGGLLAKRLREIELKLRKITGYKTKIVEGVGRKMKNVLSNTDPWRGQPCGRKNCPVCLQAGEQKLSCRKRNLIYESRCLKCNPKEEG